MSNTTNVVKFKTPTCVLCRQRKLRCDGETPCGPCSRARSLVVCTYVPKTVGQLRSELPKGGACLSCRQRKRRCDGKLPCRTCQSTSRPQECKYQERPPTRKSKPTRNNRDRRDGASTSSRSSNTSPPHTPGHSGSLDLLPDSTDDLTSFLNSCLPVDESGMYDREGWDPSAIPEFSSLTSFLDSEYRDIPPATSSPPIILPSLPSLDHPSQSAVSFSRRWTSDQTAELFAMRNLFLDHGWQWAFNVSPEKRDALSRGDTSGLVVHPVLVNVCQLLGYLIASHHEPWLYHPDQTEREAAQAALIFDFLQGNQNPLDPSTAIQVYTMVALYYHFKGDITMLSGLLRKLAALVLHCHDALGLDDSPTLSSTPELDSSSCCPQGPAQEARSAFSAVIILELSRTMLFKHPTFLDPLLLTRFRQLAAIHWRDTEMNFLRAKTSLFLSDSLQLLEEWRQWDLGQPASTAWYRRYWRLIEDIRCHLCVINTPLVETSCIQEIQVLTLKTCVVMGLAALANLYALFAPFQHESRCKHNELVQEIAGITSMFFTKDFEFLDTVLVICWSIALQPIGDDGRAPQWDVRSHASRQPLMDLMYDCREKLRQATPHSHEM
ncbi:hypothetical protein C8R43DRAFT_262386 [Mycena crocata]|nr:hypothetical protein C8R43DRAFT_262386 [Mycena crocata]